MGTYEPVAIERFGGLGFAEGYGENGFDSALGASNVELGPGAIRDRKGFDNHTSSAAAAEYSQLFAHSDSILLARRTTTLAAINTSGAEATTTTVADAFTTFARLGTPSASYTFIADGTSTLTQYDGSTFTAGTTLATVDTVSGRAMPKGKFLAVTGTSNRLVIAGTATSGGPHGVASGGSFVWFSDPGAPTTFDTDNYVQLDPGDGEEIVGCVTWRDYTFVLKPSKMFLFYGESIDSSGDPVFNYRAVPLGTDASCHTPVAVNGNATVTTSPDGVYYIGPSGVWLTTGDVPSSVSDGALRRLRLTPSPDGYSGSWQGRDAGIYHHLGRLYIALDPTNAATYQTLVYDPYYDAWFNWFPRVKGYATWKNGGSEPILFSAARDINGTGKHVVKWSNDTTSYADDNGVAFSSSYSTNWSDLGIPDEKTVRQIEVWGSGTPTILVAADFDARTVSSAVALNTSDSLQLSPTKDYMRKAIKGTYFRVAVTSTTPYKIERIVLHLREARPPGTKSA